MPKTKKPIVAADTAGLALSLTVIPSGRPYFTVETYTPSATLLAMRHGLEPICEDAESVSFAVDAKDAPRFAARASIGAAAFLRTGVAEDRDEVLVVVPDGMEEFLMDRFAGSGGVSVRMLLRAFDIIHLDAAPTEEIAVACRGKVGRMSTWMLLAIDKQAGFRGRPVLHVHQMTAAELALSAPGVGAVG